MSFNCIVFNSDNSGCYRYRICIPSVELKRFGVHTTCYPILPNNPAINNIGELVRLIHNFDMVILQRCTILNVMSAIKAACHIAGKPLVYETDDDYINLPPHNPAYLSMVEPGLLDRYLNAKKKGDNAEMIKLAPVVEQDRQESVQRYKQLLGMADLVTVSTAELASVIYPHNKNVVVLQNNIENVFFNKDYSVEEVDSDGRLVIKDQKFGVESIPSYWKDEKGKLNRILRVGYSGTVSHREDWKSIHHAWQKLVKKYADKVWFVYIGDNYFFEKQEFGRDRRMFIPPQPYELYLTNIRNIDIGVCPLLPDTFNMSKSDIKFLEYSAWSGATVAPNYITYNRSIEHGKNGLLYNNSGEFFDMMEEIIHNHELRLGLSASANKYVAENRLERFHSEKRYNIYKDLIEGRKPNKYFEPKELVNV
jgi:glycosyltransferase involved in cell wall biosynthesis